MRFFIGLWTLISFVTFLHAGTIISNLQTPFDQQVIGDVHTIYKDAIPTIGFHTAATGAFAVNAVTVERLSVPSTSPSGDLRLEMFTSSSLTPQSSLGYLSYFATDPTPTFWPAYSKFVVFRPDSPMVLQPGVSYWLAAENSTFNSSDGLFFVNSTASTGLPGVAIIDSAYARYNGSDLVSDARPLNFLKFGIEATQVPEPGPTALFGLAAVCLISIRKRMN